MKAIFYSILLLCLAAGQVYTQLEANTDYQCPLSQIKKIDTTVQRIVSFTHHVRPFPETRRNITKYCRQTQKDVNFLFDENDRCLLGTAKRFTRVIFSSVRSMVSRLCENRNSKKRTAEILKIGTCMNSIHPEADICMNVFYDYLQRGKWAEPEENRIGYACCGYYKLVDCITKAAKKKKESNNRCSGNAPELTRDFVNNLFAAIMNVACGDYADDNSDQCERLPEPPPREANEPKAISFYLPLVELYNNL